MPSEGNSPFKNPDGIYNDLSDLEDELVLWRKELEYQ